MIFRQLFDRDSYTYTYLLADQHSGEAVLIDAVVTNVEQYLQLLKELDLTLILAIDTHTHADHITAMGALRDRTGCETKVGQESGAHCASGTYKDGDILNVKSFSLETLYTPGHTDDCYSFYVASKGYLFTGDTLLIRGTGRTDFQSGNAETQYASLQKLLQLPGETVVYPGHDYRGWSQTTLAEERAHNPRLQVKDAKAYAELMGNLHLPHPKMMDVAVPANLTCGKTKL